MKKSIFLVLLIALCADFLSAQIFDKITDLAENATKTKVPYDRVSKVEIFEGDSLVFGVAFDSMLIEGERVIGYAADKFVNFKVEKNGSTTTLVAMDMNVGFTLPPLTFNTKDLPSEGTKDSVMVKGVYKTRLSENKAFLYFSADPTAQNAGQKALADGKAAAMDGLKQLGVLKPAASLFKWDKLEAFILTAPSAEPLSFSTKFLVKETKGEKVILTYEVSGDKVDINQYFIIHALRVGNDLKLWFAFAGGTEEEVVEMDNYILAVDPMLTTSAKKRKSIRKKGGVVDCKVLDIPEQLRAGLSIGATQAMTIKLSFKK